MFHCYYHPTGIVLIEEVEASIMDIDILLPILWEWLEFAVRWLHVITAISWIGTSFYFIALFGMLDCCKTVAVWYIVMSL